MVKSVIVGIREGRHMLPGQQDFDFSRPQEHHITSVSSDLEDTRGATHILGGRSLREAEEIHIP